MPRPKFDYSLNYAELDLRAHPELYRVGIGEQGVLLVQPYKGEILPHWRFATPEEKARMLREFMCLESLPIYRSATARENSQALRDIIRDVLGEEAVGVYQAGLNAALAASRS